MNIKPQDGTSKS